MFQSVRLWAGTGEAISRSPSFYLDQWLVSKRLEQFPMRNHLDETCSENQGVGKRPLWKVAWHEKIVVMRCRCRKPGQQSKRGKEVKKVTTVYSSKSHLAWLSFLSIAEQRVYIENTKISPVILLTGIYLEIPTQEWSSDPLAPNIPIHPPLRLPIISGNASGCSYVVYQQETSIPPLLFIMSGIGNTKEIPVYICAEWSLVIFNKDNNIVEEWEQNDK